MPDPKIMLLDEPFGAVDAITRINLQNELLRIHRETKKTFLLVTHDINEAMKLAASKALASIVCEEMPEEIYKTLTAAYPREAAQGVFEGKCPLKSTFVIPKPFDIRVVPRVAKMVAAAAMETGVARVMIDDLDAYEKEVAARIAAALK